MCTLCDYIGKPGFILKLPNKGKSPSQPTIKYTGGIIKTMQLLHVTAMFLRCFTILFGEHLNG